MTRIAEFDQLMADVTAGSEEAVWQLAETYTPYILRAVRRSISPQLRPKLDSQDFAQTLWASILLKRADLTRLKTPEQFIAYLAQAAKNKVIDKTRQFKTQKYNVDREENLDDYVGRKEGRESGSRVRALHSREPTPSTAASLRERWNQLLANSSERDRQILRLRIKGWTFEAISASLQIDRETARRTIQRLIQRISE